MENLTVIYDAWYHFIRDNTSVAQWTLLGTAIFVITAFLSLRDKIKKSLDPVKFGSEAFLECFGGAFGLTMFIIVFFMGLSSYNYNTWFSCNSIRILLGYVLFGETFNPRII